MIFKREQTDEIMRGAQYFPVVAILGPRQSGKTTLSQMVFKKHTYVTLEDPDLRAAAVQDPRTFLLANRNDHGIIIDEFQYVPELLSYIQTIVDKEKKPGYFILTGSQNFLMNQSITQSLAGRVSIHTLLPLSLDELKLNDALPSEVEQAIYQGCYPAIYTQSIPPDLLYKNYMQTYIERDVRLLTNIGDLNTFQTFLTMCAARIGQPVNLTSLGNECGVSDHTIKRWISILQASYIAFVLQPYHTNINKRLVKTPKLYFYDTGLVCYLLKIKQVDIAMHPSKGNLFESLMLSEVLKWHYNHGKIPSVYFWQDKSGNEIDCIIEHGRTVVPVEFKAGRTTSDRFFQSLKSWQEDHPQFGNKGFVVFGGAAEQTRGYSNLLSWQSMDKVFDEIK